MAQAHEIRTAARQRGAQSTKPYAPVKVLVDMGFDEESAKVAIAAAAGDVDRAVRLMLEDNKAQQATQQAEWEFEGDRGWVSFDVETNELLKEAVARGEAACEIRSGGRRYFVDFDSLTQLNLASHKSRRIRKKRAPD